MINAKYFHGNIDIAVNFLKESRLMPSKSLLSRCILVIAKLKSIWFSKVLTRATKNVYKRKRGLNRFEKQVKFGWLTKSHINNKGYNKYLKLSDGVVIEIDYD